MIDLLKSIPATIYTAILTAIVTASATLIGVLIAQKGGIKRLQLSLDHERNTKKNDLLRERIEELYFLSSQYATHLFSHYLPYLSVMNNHLTYNQALDQTIEQGKKLKYDFNRIEMIIDLYFPIIREPYEGLLQQRDRANEILASHKKGYKEGDFYGKKYIKPLKAVMGEIDKSFYELKEAIKSLSGEV